MKKPLCILLAVLLTLTGCAAAKAPLYADQEKIVIALLDTGVSETAIAPAGLLEGRNYVTETTDTDDRHNHGTAVTSLILGSASAGIDGAAEAVCLVLPLVVSDGKTAVSPEILAQAIRDSVDVYGADLINVSLGIRKDSEALRNAVEYAESRGVAVIAAVGNDGSSDTAYYPAAYDTVLAVGSHDRDGNVSRFSQQNGTAQILAQGEDLHMASRDGRVFVDRGTSYAAAFVTAAAARLLAKAPTLTPAQLRQLLLRTAAAPDATGCGLLDVEAALSGLT